MLGCSHPDVVAGHNTCVLFDENPFPLNPRDQYGADRTTSSTAMPIPARLCFATTAPGLVYPDWGCGGPFTFRDAGLEYEDRADAAERQ